MKKNFKTTLAGIVGGASIVIEALYEAWEKGIFTSSNKKEIVIGVAIIALGALSKDYNEKN